MFISFITTKNEVFVCNISKIEYIGETKYGAIVYLDEFTQVTVKQTVTEICSLFDELKILIKAKGGKN